MNLFKILDNLTGSKLSKEVLEDVQKELRYHERLPLVPGDPISVVLPSGHTARLVDISYGGVLLHVSGSRLPNEEAFRAVEVLTLEHMGKTNECHVVSIRNINIFETGAMVAYEFRHQSAESLVFLKHIIEPMRFGKSLSKLSPEFLKEPYNGENWACYRGDGPTDVLAEYSDKGDVLERLIMTFREEARYLEVRYKGGKVTTAKTEKTIDAHGDVGAASALVKQTAKIDQDILRSCAGIIMGFDSEIREELSEFVATMFARIERNKKTAA
jgi:hypothetical protein